MQVSAKRWTERVLSCVSKCFIHVTYRLHTQQEINTLIQIWGKENKIKKMKLTGFLYVTLWGTIYMMINVTEWYEGVI